ncbi:MAG: helix-turn-helix transcriptional regulator, partial [Pseudomonadota bacterium]
MKEQNHTQSSLARRLKLTPQTIGKLVRGEANSSAHLHRIARELRTTSDYLLGETDDPEIEAEGSILTDYEEEL